MQPISTAIPIFEDASRTVGRHTENGIEVDAVTQWIQNNDDTKNPKFGYFDASSGADNVLYADSGFDLILNR